MTDPRYGSPVAGAIVEGRGVVKRWGSTLALAGVDFAIGPGVTGLLGANGAGKTTLLGLLLGMHSADSGSLSVLGLDPATQGPLVRARIGYAPEHDSLPPDVSAHDIVRHLAELHGLPRREATGRASDVLYELGLGEERFRHVGTMSTGQRQRVKLAQAIGHDPELVLLDEPTNGLDPVQRDEMLRLIHRVGHTLGIHVILSSHLLEEVERVSDAVVILDQGRAVAGGQLADLRTEHGELLVQVDGDAAAVVDRLRAKGIAAEATAGRIVVPFADEQVYDDVRDAIASARASLRRLERRTSSLEDVFLAAGDSA